MATPSTLEEKENFNRLSTLLLHCGTKALQRLLMKHVQSFGSNKTLDQFLAQLNVQQLTQKKVLHLPQKKILFPPTGNADIKQFDISLLCTVLKNACSLSPQEKNGMEDLREARNIVYGHIPNDAVTNAEFKLAWNKVKGPITTLAQQTNDQTFMKEIIDDIKRVEMDTHLPRTNLSVLEQWYSTEALLNKLRDLEENLDNLSEKINEDSAAADNRHQLVLARQNMIQSAVDESGKGTKCVIQNVEQIIIKGQKNVSDQLDVMNKDVVENRENLTSLMAQYNLTSVETQRDILAQIESLPESFKDAIRTTMAPKVKLENPVLANLLRNTSDTTQCCLKQGFIETEQYKRAIEIAKSDRCLLITGKPGEGKTTSAIHIIECLGNPGRCIMLKDPSEWIHVDTEEVDVVLIDDMFGQYKVDAGKLSKWLSLVSEMEAAIENRKIHIVMTTRKEVYAECEKQLKRRKLFQSHVAFSSELLTLKEKEDILKKALLRANKSLEEDDQSKCIQTFASPIGFPYCCQLFATESQLFEKGAKFFEKPYAFFFEVIEEKLEPLHLLLLFLIFCCGGKLDVPSVRHKKWEEMKDTLSILLESINAELSGVPSLTTITSRLDAMDGTYIAKMDRNSYSFAHGVVYEAVGLILGKRDPDIVIKSCGRDFLCQCVTTFDNEQTGNLSEKMYIPEDCSGTLSCRLISEVLENKEVISIATHDMFRNPNFLGVLLKILKEEQKTKSFWHMLETDKITNQSTTLFPEIMKQTSADMKHTAELVLECLETMADEDEDKSWLQKQKQLALHNAFLNDDMSVPLFLMSKGAIAETSALQNCVSSGNASLVNKAIAQLKERDCLGATEEDVNNVEKAMFWAYGLGHVGIARVLLSVLSSVNASQLLKSLWWAVGTKNTEVVRDVLDVILSNGIDLSDMHDALDLAFVLGASEIQKLLQDSGMKILPSCVCSVAESGQLDVGRDVFGELKSQYMKHTCKKDLLTKEVFLLFQKHLGALGEAASAFREDNLVALALSLKSKGIEAKPSHLYFGIISGLVPIVGFIVNILKDTKQWEPSKMEWALFQAYRLGLGDVADFLIQNGLIVSPGCLLAAVMSMKTNIVEDVARKLHEMRLFSRGHPDIEKALDEASKLGYRKNIDKIISKVVV